MSFFVHPKPQAKPRQSLMDDNGLGLKKKVSIRQSLCESNTPKNANIPELSFLKANKEMESQEDKK